MFQITKLSSWVFYTIACFVIAEGSVARELTYSGGIKAGNKNGSIPGWTGGLTAPPGGWDVKKGYKNR